MDWLLMPSIACACDTAGSEPEPARSPGRAELLLLGGVVARGVKSLGRRRGAAEEVDLDLADEPVAELGVADARPSVRCRWLPAGDRGRNVVGHDKRGRLGEDPGLGDGAGTGTDVAEGVDLRELGPEVGLVDGYPAVDGEARGGERVGRPMDRDADEKVVWQRAAARELRRARRRIDA